MENPNRVAQKQKKVSQVTEAAKPQLSRREREELEKQRAKAHYQKLHAEGKTDEARADLARLAIIRKQREEAAKKREEEKKGTDSVSVIFSPDYTCTWSPFLRKIELRLVRAMAQKVSHLSTEMYND